LQETEKRTLVLVPDPHLDSAIVSRLRTLSGAGATIIAWQHRPIVQDRFRSPDVAAELSRLGISARTLSEALDADFELDEAVIAWMKDLGRRAFRGRFRWGPLDLWWWAEIYLYHETPLRLIVRDIEALARLVERDVPERLVLVHPLRAMESAARRLVRDVEVLGKSIPGLPRPRRTDLLFLLDLLKMWGTAAKSIFRGPPPAKSGGSEVFFLTHASMWSEGREIYFHDILPAVASRAGDPVVVAFGPPVPFRKRGIAAWLRDLFEMGASRRPYVAVRRYFSPRMGLRLTREFLNARALFRELTSTPDMVEALLHRGVPLGAEALASFRDTFLRQFPWAKRSFLEVEAVLLHERPKVLVLYAESSGLGRAAVAAARTHGIPSVAVQHGIMYPQYYSHEHAPDEVVELDELEGSAVPLPTRTAVFGELAKDLLMRRGSYPPDRIVVTGSPKFDALVQGASAYHPGETRRALGVPGGGRFVVLATRWSAVGEPVFEELVRAVESLEDVFLFVKPHQAESPRPYEVVVERLLARRTCILPAERNLLELLFASDGLVTVDSLASSEALVLGRPVLILNLPGNLSSLVDRGAALGVRRGESIATALQSFLFDPETARALAEKRKQYIQDFAFGADGRATERIVECILSEGLRVDA
jgi:glycosyltransferase involved in cell wall biosynthesis